MNFHQFCVTFAIFVHVRLCTTERELNSTTTLSVTNPSPNKTTRTRHGRTHPGIMELSLNPYDPVSRMAIKVWDRLFSEKHGKFRVSFFNSPTTTTAAPPQQGPSMVYLAGPFTTPPTWGPVEVEAQAEEETTTTETPTTEGSEPDPDPTPDYPPQFPHGFPPFPHPGGPNPPFPYPVGLNPLFPNMGGPNPQFPHMGGQNLPFPHMGGQNPQFPQPGGPNLPFPQPGGPNLPFPQPGGPNPPFPHPVGPNHPPFPHPEGPNQPPFPHPEGPNHPPFPHLEGPNPPRPFPGGPNTPGSFHQGPHPQGPPIQGPHLEEAFQQGPLQQPPFLGFPNQPDNPGIPPQQQGPFNPTLGLINNNPLGNPPFREPTNNIDQVSGGNAGLNMRLTPLQLMSLLLPNAFSNQQLIQPLQTFKLQTAKDQLSNVLMAALPSSDQSTMALHSLTLPPHPQPLTILMAAPNPPDKKGEEENQNKVLLNQVYGNNQIILTKVGSNATIQLPKENQTATIYSTMTKEGILFHVKKSDNNSTNLPMQFYVAPNLSLFIKSYPENLQREKDNKHIDERNISQSTEENEVSKPNSRTNSSMAKLDQFQGNYLIDEAKKVLNMSSDVNISLKK